MNKNYMQAQNGCGYHVLYKNNVDTNNKYIYKDTTDNSIPYGYEHSDLKNLYLSRHQLASKNIAPIMTQEELLIQKSQK